MPPRAILAGVRSSLHELAWALHHYRLLLLLLLVNTRLLEADLRIVSLAERSTHLPLTEHIVIISL